MVFEPVAEMMEVVAMGLVMVVVFELVEEMVVLGLVVGEGMDSELVEAATMMEVENFELVETEAMGATVVDEEVMLEQAVELVVPFELVAVAEVVVVVFELVVEMELEFQRVVELMEVEVVFE